MIEIDDLALKVPVYLGTSDANLNRGAGAVTNAGFNNFAIAAHRDSYFRKLANIKKNQQIRVRNDDGTTEIYSVQDIIIVDPGDTQILNESATPTLTLITCYPFYYVGSAPQRYIVKAKLVNH
nr:class D sortase [Echinimonas agarilytica]